MRPDESAPSKSGLEQPPSGDESGGKPTRRRLDDVFGDVLPDASRDDRPDQPDHPSQEDDDALLRDVPPHHG